MRACGAVLVTFAMWAFGCGGSSITPSGTGGSAATSGAGGTATTSGVAGTQSTTSAGGATSNGGSGGEGGSTLSNSDSASSASSVASSGMTGSGGSGGRMGSGGSMGSGGLSGSGGSGGMMGSGGSGGGGGADPCAGKPGIPGEFTIDVMSSGDVRKVLVHVPASYDASAPAQLVLAFHGYTDTAEAMEMLTHMSEASDAQGFIVAYPQGKAPLGLPGWNAGTCCGSASLQNVPDVAFTNDALDALMQQYCIDDHRVFAAGFSNGGMLAHRLGCELSQRIAAIASGSGTIAIDTCTPTRPVPVLHMHGTSDAVVPYNGGIFAKSVPDTISGWVTRNGCASPSAVVYQKGTATCEAYSGCMEGATVELCKVEGGAHDWFGGGNANGMGDLVNTDQALAFFAVHPKP